ncbi:type II secretion system F family protein [Aeromicrobium sp. CF4.19]|uniref:type II secretion system F family protein n=1 Tax=Aeromicrobium sp. CF4.19 TaxID=3373082 RepID=UPI003EE45CC2
MNAWGALAASCAMVAVLSWRPPAAWSVATRLRLPGRGRGRRLPSSRAAQLAALVPVTILVLAIDATAPALAAVTVAGVALFVLQQVRAQRQRARREATRVEVCGALDLLAAELRGGILASHALLSAATATDSLRPVRRAAAEGGDVPSALRAAATQPGAAAWAALAAGWAVAERAGAPMADVVEQIADTVRDDLDLVREVATEAAPARATGRLMAMLPVLGLGLGAGMGADPVHLLTRTVPGALCLAAGAAMACLGTWWVERIVAGAQAPP